LDSWCRNRLGQMYSLYLSRNCSGKHDLQAKRHRYMGWAYLRSLWVCCWRELMRLTTMRCGRLRGSLAMWWGSRHRKMTPIVQSFLGRLRRCLMGEGCHSCSWSQWSTLVYFRASLSNRCRHNRSITHSFQRRICLFWAWIFSQFFLMSIRSHGCSSLRSWSSHRGNQGD